MKNTAAGRETGRSRIFGAFSRFRVFEVETRFGVSEWFVTDAEKRDDVTGLPAVIRQAATEAEAVAGMSAGFTIDGADGEALEVFEVPGGYRLVWYSSPVPCAPLEAVFIAVVDTLGALVAEAARALHSGFYRVPGPVPTREELEARIRHAIVTAGQAVEVNGFRGSITDVCTGTLEGMAVVRLARGSVCVGLSEVRAAR